MKKPLIVIAGPTACGKTDISIDLAEKIGGEIISGDSMQVYKYMDIGTAKVTKEEMRGIPHYLVDELYPDEEYNVMLFQQKAKQYMEGIYSRGHIPIIVGGTGFYINALVYDNDFSEEEESEIRKELYAVAENEGAEKLHAMLAEVDPEYAANIHHNNIKRVARALEYYRLTGEKMSEHNKNAKEKETPYNLAFFVLNMDREKLYERINLRVDIMMNNGLEQEVRKLIEMGYSPELVSMQGLGYKEFIPYFNGEISLEQVVDDIKKYTRRFAKRQLTWFRGQTNGTWLDMGTLSKDKALEIMLDELKTKKIIEG
ncbi:tRNA (adenosine(37)-N6)-dimethylallyltransferase MiaA [Anaerotignum sp. MSJ-24]|uniref:tRNA (adenosine(37)-N6)-dimethylallyltransferase MiaA n=1 Tax=Anaerotignum sp. MSJ-24 TaxID=2841521 RepID=UPI001C125005|nr:tRNA (adenosine(37)-N6)-dimethylallyltransferase MiaA [Anaerotignum sp. MSJ-24]MBU5463819.1 tRNA (adenosine(37)-N6)-dimethylallyltransferase MiaA [Anaerotignum sp. MSJ-24]